MLLTSPSLLYLHLPEAVFVTEKSNEFRPGLVRALLDIKRLLPDLVLSTKGEVTESQKSDLQVLKRILASESIMLNENIDADNHGIAVVGSSKSIIEALPHATIFDLDSDVKQTWAELPSRIFKPRIAQVQRKTHETAIDLTLNVDGSGKSDIKTGLGFFDHMLDQIARHAGCDLTLHCDGDLHVDEHHTVEDVGLALGEAFSIALGDKRGLTRYGFILPMDEAQARVALDFSGRSYLVWQAQLRRERVGELPTELVPHFFKSLCDTARLTLHITVEGDNDHHQIEAAFKGFARALRSALRRDPFSGAIPSTKGLL